MKRYFDTCCYGRPFDSLAQASVRREIAAINNAIRLCKTAGHVIYGSAAVSAEIDNIGDGKLRGSVLSFYISTVNEEAVPSESINRRAEVLSGQGLKNFDPYHAAFAEAVCADYLLTTDARFERTASTLKLAVIVMNPVTIIKGGYIT